MEHATDISHKFSSTFNMKNVYESPKKIFNNVSLRAYIGSICFENHSYAIFIKICSSALYMSPRTKIYNTSLRAYIGSILLWNSLIYDFH